MDNARKPYAIPPAAEASLERRLGAAGVPVAFVDLKGVSGQPEFRWLHEPVSARYNGQHEQTLVPAKQYDALLFISRVSPASFLYY